MQAKGDILDLRRKTTSFDKKGGVRMFTITKIFVDGFRNISNTTIRFAEPVTVLLAPNNFGKTNILHSIEFAATLIGKGMEAQEKLLKDNGYTSYNIFTDFETYETPKCFSFQIEFLSDERRIDYFFQISPKNGVAIETLKCGHETLFERKGEGKVSVGGTTIYVSPYNLLVSFLTDIEISATKYADSVRKIFFSMLNMFCNRESPYGDYSIRKKDLFNLTRELILLFHNDPIHYMLFRETFLELFHSIEDFAIYDVRDRSREKFRDWPADFRVEDYRLEFTTAGKRRPELYSDLSTGTQDIFLVLFEIFTKKKNPLVVIEEIENGIHPSLYRKVLKAISKVCNGKRALVTTHSPSVARHFDERSFSSFYVGVPDRDGRATFAALDDTKKEIIEKKASTYGISIGELIIDMLSDTEDSIKELKGWLRV